MGGVITSGGMCEIKCLPGYERVSPQLLKCERRHWEHYKLTTGETNGKIIDIEDIKCVKIPTQELTEFEKKKIEVFEPPKQLGLPEVNEIVKPSKQPNTTPKKTPTKLETEEKSSTGSKSGSLPKPTAASEQESEPEAEPEPEPEPESSSSSVSNDDEEPEPEAETRATIKPQTIKPSGSKSSSDFVAPT